MSVSQPSRIISEIAEDLGVSSSEESKIKFPFERYTVRTIVGKSNGWYTTITLPNGSRAELEYSYKFAALLYLSPRSSTFERRKYYVPSGFVPVVLYSLFQREAVLGILPNRAIFPLPSRNHEVFSGFIRGVHDGGLVSTTEITIYNDGWDKFVIQSHRNGDIILIDMHRGVFFKSTLGIKKKSYMPFRGVYPGVPEEPIPPNEYYVRPMNHLLESILVVDDRALMKFD